MTDRTHADHAQTRGLATSALFSAGARMAVLGLSAVFTFASADRILERYGTQTFAAFALSASLVAMLPFLDLGTGTAVTNAYAKGRDEATGAAALAVLLTSYRATFLAASAVALGAASASALDLWQTVLGSTATSNVEAPMALAGVLLAGSIPLGLGQRILIGLDKAHIQIAIQALQAPVTFVGVLGVSATEADATWTIPCSYVGLMAVAITSHFTAVHVAGLSTRVLLLKACSLRGYRGSSIAGTAWPAFVINISLPIAVQSDRVVLAHVRSARDVAVYSLGAMIFTPVTATVAAAGQALWPRFMKMRLALQRPPLVMYCAAFAAGAAILGTIVALVSPLLTRLVGDSTVLLSPILCLAFVTVAVVTALQYPLGIWLIDPEGLRYQAAFVATALPVNVILSVLLARAFGAAGPLFATAIVILLMQIVPYSLRIWRIEVRA